MKVVNNTCKVQATLIFLVLVACPRGRIKLQAQYLVPKKISSPGHYDWMTQWQRKRLSECTFFQSLSYPFTFIKSR